MGILVITPTLGKSRHLQQTLDSIRERAKKHSIRTVLITPAGACPTISVEHLDSEVMAQRSCGLYAALNDGFQACRSETWQWFTFLNDDDLWLKGIAETIEMAEQDVASPQIIFGRVKLIGADDRSLGELPVTRNPGDLHALLARGIIPFAQPGTLIHRNVVEELGGFDETYRSAGDLDFFVRALAKGVCFKFVNHHVAAFRLHAGQISKNEATAIQEKERALEPLRGSSVGGVMPLVRFRVANMPAYLDRIRRFGFADMAKVYRTQ